MSPVIRCTCFNFILEYNIKLDAKKKKKTLLQTSKYDEL